MIYIIMSVIILGLLYRIHQLNKEVTIKTMLIEETIECQRKSLTDRMVEFAHYVLSEEREEMLKSNYVDNSYQERFRDVSHADITNYFNKKKMNDGE